MYLWIQNKLIKFQGSATAKPHRYPIDQIVKYYRKDDNLYVTMSNGEANFVVKMDALDATTGYNGGVPPVDLDDIVTALDALKNA